MYCECATPKCIQFYGSRGSAGRHGYKDSDDRGYLAPRILPLSPFRRWYVYQHSRTVPNVRAKWMRFHHCYKDYD